MPRSKPQRWLAGLTRLGCVCVALGFQPLRLAAQAPVVDDGSLGGRGGDLTVMDNRIEIDSTRGQTAGANLFHSFTRFHVPEDVTARFTGPASIRNVITRVTGGEASQIDGTIDTISSMPLANFYLLNPAGIRLGSFASLDVGGSVVLSTADQAKFSDGRVFSSRITDGETLSSASVSSFGFLSDQPQEIRVEDSWIHLRSDGRSEEEPASNLSLVSGDITITGSEPEMVAEAVNLVAVGAAAGDAGGTLREVSFDPTDRNSLPMGEALGTVNVTGASFETALIRMLGGDLVIHLSELCVEEFDSRGQGLLMNAARSIRVSDSDVFTHGGALTLNARSIYALDSFISSGSGKLSMAARDISLRRGSSDRLYVEVSSLALNSMTAIRAGDVELNAEDSITIEGYSVFSNALGENSTGNVTVRAGGRLRLSESLSNRPDIGEISTIAADSPLPMSGPDNKVGDVTVAAGRIEIRGAAEISSSSFLLDAELADSVAGAFAGSGDVKVTARQGIQMDGRKPEGQMGAGVSDGFTGIFSQFPGGFRALPSFFEDAIGPAVGDAGNVSVEVTDGTLSLRHGARISSSGALIDPDRPSRAGNVEIATPRLFIEGVGDRRTFDLFDVGAIETGIFSESFRGGGNITVRGSEEIVIRKNGEISSLSFSGLSGDIRLVGFRKGAVVRLEDANLLALSGGAGSSGGDVLIAQPRSLILRDSLINSSALGSGGRGGNITLSSTVFLQERSVLDASASSGVSGRVSGADLPVNLSDVVAPVRAAPVGDSLTLPRQSAVFQSRDISGHAVAGRGRRPLTPKRYQLTFDEAADRKED